MIKHSIFVCRWASLSEKDKNFMVWKVTLTLTERYGFSPECFVKCIFNCPPCEKALGHSLQGNVFSPKFVLQWFFKLQASEKVIGHWLQTNVFSPECILKCVFKCPLFEKSLGHWLQGNNFSAECILKCCFKCPTFYDHIDKITRTDGWKYYFMDLYLAILT